MKHTNSKILKTLQALCTDLSDLFLNKILLALAKVHFTGSFFFMPIIFLWCDATIVHAQQPDVAILEVQFKANPTAEAANALSKSYQNLALWYRKMPHFDRDSTVYFFNKAIALLENSKPMQYERLTEIYTDVLSRSNRSHPFLKIDSIAAKGWQHFEQIPKSQRNKMVEYNFLNAWSSIKVEKGELKNGLDLYTKAYELLKDDRRTEIQAKVLKDKGRFYSRYGLPEERAAASENLKQSMKLYESVSDTVSEKNESLMLIYKMFVIQFGENKADKDSAAYFYAKVKALLPVLNNPFHYNWYYTQASSDLLEDKNFDAALSILLEGKKFAEDNKITNTDAYVIEINSLGHIAKAKRQFDAAIGYYLQGHDIALKNNFKPLAIESLNFLSEVYEMKGDYVQSLAYYKQFMDETQKMDKERSARSLREKELQLNVAKQEKEISQKTSQQGLLIGATIIAILLMGIFAFIFYRERKTKTKLEHKNQIIEQQTQVLQQLDASKSRFFANVSHELRTPLTLMLAPLGSSLKSNSLDNKNFTFVSLAQQHAKQLLGLVNEILDLTKLESGKMTVHEEATDVYNFLRRLVSAFESYANQRGIQMVYNFEPTVPHTLLLDKPKFEKVFNNLISNAIKFTPYGGTITVNVSHTLSRWEISVADTGQGIHPNDLPQVFNRFYQSNQTDMPIEGGTGIGLALANELAQVMNGKLTVESVFGNGATFKLELPKKEILGSSKISEEQQSSDELVVATEDKTANNSLNRHNAPQVPSTQNSKIKKRILVVEDNISLRSYLQLILSDDYEVITAENGQMALTIMNNVLIVGDTKNNDAHHHKNSESLKLNDKRNDTANVPTFNLIDLVVSDIMMPVMDGFQLLDKLKSEEKWRAIPIIMLTARAEMHDKLRALTFGVDDFLVKPFEEEELFARIKNLLKNAEIRKNAQHVTYTTESETLVTENPVHSAPIPQHAHRSSNSLVQTAILSQLDKDWLTELEKTVRAHLTDFNLSVDGIAELMFMSRAQFFRRVQTLIGLTPNQYLQDIRFNHARTLLETRQMSTVKAVASAIGIQKIQYFSEHFKERFGKSPSEYLV